MLSFDQIVFGPIHSRRLGQSLGINLMPLSGKLCNFDCVYCECGWNKDSVGKDHTLPRLDQIRAAMQERFAALAADGVTVDSITFSGNGEPTLHPDFPSVVDTTVELRNKYLPSSKISVLSNATMLGRPGIIEALKKVERPVLKLDAPFDSSVALINRPTGHYSVDSVVENLCRFDGNFVLQTMFMHGGGFDFSLDREGLDHWLDLVRKTHPRVIMAYTLDRETPMKGLSKMSEEQIRELLGPLFDEGFNIKING